MKPEKERRFQENTNLAKLSGLKFESKNNGLHLIIEGRYDFWPTTGRWMERRRPLTSADPITGPKLKQGSSWKFLEETIAMEKGEKFVIINKAVDDHLSPELHLTLKGINEILSRLPKPEPWINSKIKNPDKDGKYLIWYYDCFEIALYANGSWHVMNDEDWTKINFDINWSILPDPPKDTESSINGFGQLNN